MKPATLILSPDGWHRARLSVSRCGVCVEMQRRSARGSETWVTTDREVITDQSFHVIRDAVYDFMQTVVVEWVPVKGGSSDVCPSAGLKPCS